MNNRREVTALVGAGNVSLQFAQEHSDKIAVLDRVVSTARLGLMVLGLASMTALTVMFFRPELTDQVKVMSPFWTKPASAGLTNPQGLNLLADTTDSLTLNAVPAGLNGAPGAFSAPSVAARQRVTGWLAKRHRVAGAASKMLARGLHDGKRNGYRSLADLVGDECRVTHESVCRKRDGCKRSDAGNDRRTQKQSG